MNKIARIETVDRCWELGKETVYKSGKFITEIRDMNMEFEDSASVHVAYDIFVNGKLYKSLINLPVTVEYDIRGEPND